MHVIATAGHVDHGKSTLVRALTGMEPDRWAEERRRGMTLDLGFAWTTLRPAHPRTGGTVGPAIVMGVPVAFVDVPGHERFVPTMLAGVGPVPAVLLVIAADEGWMPQTTEHVAALDALGVHHGLLAVTRTDVADPGPVIAAAERELARTSLAGVQAVAVCAPSGDGLAQLREQLAVLAAGLSDPDPDAPVRLWIDRSFTVAGAGTVVTGTLPAGRVRVGDTLTLSESGSGLAGGHDVVVRGVQMLGHRADQAVGVARVALNLRGVRVRDVHRGDVLTTPGAYRGTTVVDVRLHPPYPGAPADPGAPTARGLRLPGELRLHLGSAALTVRVRLLGADAARITLPRGLPLRIGDRGLLRDPGAHRVVAGITALDVAPPDLGRRGAAAARAATLGAMSPVPDAAAELHRRRLARADELRAMGVVDPLEAVHAGAWLVDPAYAETLRQRLAELLEDHRRTEPLADGLAVSVAAQRLGLPDPRLVAALLPGGVRLRAGRLEPDATRPRLPDPVEAGLAVLAAQLTADPFTAPSAHRLDELGLGPRELAAAERSGRLVRLADGVVLGPDAVARATRVLTEQAGGPGTAFTVSQARQWWGTSRRVAVPLLELLDRARMTQRLPDDRRVLLVSGPPGADRAPVPPRAAPHEPGGERRSRSARSPAPPG